MEKALDHVSSKSTEQGGTIESLKQDIKAANGANTIYTNQVSELREKLTETEAELDRVVLKNTELNKYLSRVSMGGS